MGKSMISWKEFKLPPLNLLTLGFYHHAIANKKGEIRVKEPRKSPKLDLFYWKRVKG